jgi:hypothetical protein
LLSGNGPLIYCTVHIIKTLSVLPRFERSLVSQIIIPFFQVNLVYECRVCLNMFRSLANLVSHKQRFCRHRYAAVRHEFKDKCGGRGDDGGDQGEDKRVTVCIEPEAVVDCCSTDPSGWDLATYSPSMELIKTAGILQQLAAVPERPLVGRLHPGGKRDINAILPRLSGCGRPAPTAGMTVRLEPVCGTSNALYQSWRLTDAQGQLLPSVKDINMTLHRIVIADDHTVVGPDGRAFETASAGSDIPSPFVSAGGEGSAVTAFPAAEKRTDQDQNR